MPLLRLSHFLSHLPAAISAAWEKSSEISNKPLPCRLGFHKPIDENILHLGTWTPDTPKICACCYTYLEEASRQDLKPRFEGRFCA